MGSEEAVYSGSGCRKKFNNTPGRTSHLYCAPTKSSVLVMRFRYRLVDFIGGIERTKVYAVSFQNCRANVGHCPMIIVAKEDRTLV